DAYLHADPSEQVALKDSVRLAFIAALQMLPPRQRVVLILRDVLAWSTRECAELLETTPASVNSALARARGTMSTHDAGPAERYDEELLMNYVAAFEAYDVQRLVTLLAEDARFSMPPYELWLQGRETIEQWWRGQGTDCKGSRTITTWANGQPAVAVYQGVGYTRSEPFGIHVLAVEGGQIDIIMHFMRAGVLAELGLLLQLSEGPQEMIKLYRLVCHASFVLLNDSLIKLANGMT